jgi:hypothetical protein
LVEVVGRVRVQVVVRKVLMVRVVRVVVQPVLQVVLM